MSAFKVARRGVLAGGADYVAHAVDGRLDGKRIGVPRARYWGYSSHADTHAERAVRLLASDDGRGAEAPSAGNGLRGMRERLAAYGGNARISTRPGAGFALDLYLPLDDRPPVAGTQAHPTHALAGEEE